MTADPPRWMLGAAAQEPEPDELLDCIGAASRQLAAANALAAAVLEWRDRLILDAARAGRPLPAIADRAGISVQMVGKLTRAAGLRRYREREREPAGPGHRGKTGTGGSGPGPGADG
jgi:hypothetical protein